MIFVDGGTSLTDENASALENKTSRGVMSVNGWPYMVMISEDR